MTTITTGYPAAAKVLREVRKITGPNAYIAGGAARDIFLGRKPKDWDIFVPVQRKDMPDMITRLSHHWGEGVFNKPMHSYGGNSYESSYGYDNGMREEVLGVLKSTCGAVDIVFVDARFGTSAQAVVAKFDSSLSMCWLDDAGDVQGLPLFWYSLDMQVNIAVACNYGNGKHFARTAKKLTEFSVIDAGAK